VAGRTALLLGASGLVGTSCLQHLLDTPAYERVTCLVRRPLDRGKRTKEEDARLVTKVVDFDVLTSSDVDPLDDVFVAIGSTMKKAGSREAFRRIDYELPLRVTELAMNAGAKRVALVSSVGADARSSNFYLRTKGELEDAIGSLSEWRALHIFQPSVLLGDRTESRPGEALGSLALRGVRGLMLGGLRKYRPIDADDVGRAMVAAVLGPDPEPARQVHHYDAIMTLKV
jgi:uncharacterized protein YbjT (DUF2867 family)